MTTTTTSGPTSFKRTGSAPSKPTDPPADRPAASSGWRLGIASGFVGFVGAQGGQAGAHIRRTVVPARRRGDDDRVARQLVAQRAREASDR